MFWEKLRKEAYQLSVSDRLLLVLSNELRPRSESTEGTLTHLRGILKNDQLSLTDEEVAAMREE